MNKREFIEVVAKRMRVSKTDAEKFIDLYTEVVSSNMKRGQNVKLIGFGTFTCRTRKGRTGRNPRTGESIEIPSTKYVKFIPGTALKEMVK